MHGQGITIQKAANGYTIMLPVNDHIYMREPGMSRAGIFNKSRIEETEEVFDTMPTHQGIYIFKTWDEAVAFLKIYLDE